MNKHVFLEYWLINNLSTVWGSSVAMRSKVYKHLVFYQVFKITRYMDMYKII